MSCPVPPGEEHYPITVPQEDGPPVIKCAKCQQVIG